MNSEILSEAILVPTQPQVFFSKNDPDDIRLGDFVKPLAFDSISGQKIDTVILGYPDDEGIRLNGGRIGASEAPKLIRQFLYKMTPSAFKSKDLKVFDLGDLRIKGDLSQRHENVLQLLADIHRQKIKTITFGGGHDYGYSDAAGFVKSFLSSEQKPVVINFDAHLDMRPTHHGFNSGTPFYRLLSEFKDQIDFVEIGLQSQCNSENHWKWAEAHHAHLFSLNKVEENGMLALLDEAVFKKITKNTPVFISFDIDALRASEAGGCSQAWMTGLKFSECLQFLSALYKKSNTRGLGIYEVSPPLDRDFQTSKTAALLAHHFLFENI